MPSEARKGIFTTPLQNDFQWYNLYQKMFGVCTYAPPMPMNPSTTTSIFPKRKHIHGFLDDYRDSFEVDASEDCHDDKEPIFPPIARPSSREVYVSFSKKSGEVHSDENSLHLAAGEDPFLKFTGDAPPPTRRSPTPCRRG
ncbi:unnamed protein product [Phytomonas sp. Hart1]|nr:unnamed protein product [Phytomonas sp. Hart1]|eukprot:CCW68268.1 unnamed protein product [Phytomonas sp. isolate Hart1]